MCATDSEFDGVHVEVLGDHVRSDGGDRATQIAEEVELVSVEHVEGQSVGSCRGVWPVLRLPIPVQQARHRQLGPE